MGVQNPIRILYNTSFIMETFFKPINSRNRKNMKINFISDSYSSIKIRVLWDVTPTLHYTVMDHGATSTLKMESPFVSEILTLIYHTTRHRAPNIRDLNNYFLIYLLYFIFTSKFDPNLQVIHSVEFKNKP
jgi:hypothetical protein